MNKPHVKLNSSKQLDKAEKMKYNTGFGSKNENADEGEPDYTMMGERFEKSLANLINTRKTRHSNRNLRVSTHFDYIKISFFSQFSVNQYFHKWYSEFGLEVVEILDFGSTILFAVSDKSEDNFQLFLKSIEAFVKFSKDESKDQFSKLLFYVKDFELLNFQIVNEVIGSEDLIILRLADISISTGEKMVLINALGQYLEEREINFSFNPDLDIIEVHHLGAQYLNEILGNFDIIIQTLSSKATLIKPNVFNIAERSYGFEVVANDDLPIVGIIDSGINSVTPLVSTVIYDDELNITKTSVFEDNVDNGRGHGTSVGALVSLGPKAILESYGGGTLVSHARLLPIKITDSTSSYISISEVLRLLQLTKAKYPEIKIFTLTVVFDKTKKFNEGYSRYAYALDKFSYDNDCLIFISTGNNSNAILTYNQYDSKCFSNEQSVLSSPAESMNNITIGANTDNVKGNTYCGISNGKEYPAIYSRRGHQNYTLIEKNIKFNKRIFKPDLLFPGGDYGYKDGKLSDLSESCLVLLSADPTESFYSSMGTSFAAPLAAHLGARLLRLYPVLKASSIKALMLNCGNQNLVDFDDSIKTPSIGHGIVDSNEVLYSNKDRVVIILEDTINHEELKVFPIKFPDYLVEDDLKKNKGILKVTATLCFHFLPIKDNQQGYCPIHIAFGFFRNHDPLDIIEKERLKKSKLKGTMWSQDGRFKSRPIPYSNVQKISFNINVKDLVDENNVFKLGVHCIVHPQLKPGEKESYLENNAFSIVVSISETLLEENLTGKLYDELTAVNELVSLIDLDQDLELEA